MPASRFVRLEGNTFPVKDKIRALGGFWKASERVWYVPAEKLREAEALLPPRPSEYLFGGPQGEERFVRGVDEDGRWYTRRATNEDHL